jgi:hypothetical protein
MPDKREQRVVLANHTIAILIPYRYTLTCLRNGPLCISFQSSFSTFQKHIALLTIELSYTINVLEEPFQPSRVAAIACGTPDACKLVTMVCIMILSTSSFGPVTQPRRRPADRILLKLSKRSTRPSTSIDKNDGTRGLQNCKNTKQLVINLKRHIAFL